MGVAVLVAPDPVSVAVPEVGVGCCRFCFCRVAKLALKLLDVAEAVLPPSVKSSGLSKVIMVLPFASV